MTATSIYQWACTQPESTALIWNDRPLDYATFWRMIEAARGFFAVQQLAVGGTAIVLVTNLVDVWIMVMALRVLGLNTICVQSIEDAETLNLKAPACIVLGQIELQRHKLGGGAFAHTRVIAVPGTVFANARSGDLTFNQQNTIPFGGHILYTSGTTGANKKVMLHGANQELRDAARARSWSFDGRTIHHGIDFPLWTGAGFKQPSAVWHVGGCVVFDQRPDRYRHFFRQRITGAALVPTMLKALLEASPGAEIPPHEFELTVIAGFLSLGLAENAVRQLTKKIAMRYSSTELGTSTLHSRFHHLDDLHWMIPADGRTVQIVGENGTECPIGQEGELRVLVTDVDSSSYLDDAATSAKFFREGFFYPGDLAVKRADGRIRILGRTADVLNFHGTKVAVAPLEEKIQRQLGVDEVCLFSGLNDRGLEELVIAIESNRKLQRAEMEAANREFSSFERVRCVVLKQFPRAEAGMRKVQRAALRKLIW